MFPFFFSSSLCLQHAICIKRLSLLISLLPSTRSGLESCRWSVDRNQRAECDRGSRSVQSKFGKGLLSPPSSSQGICEETCAVSNVVPKWKIAPAAFCSGRAVHLKCRVFFLRIWNEICEFAGEHEEFPDKKVVELRAKFRTGEGKRRSGGGMGGTKGHLLYLPCLDWLIMK